MRKLKDRNLYLVISEEYAKDRSAASVAGLAIAGGVDMIQMREKNRSKEELIKTGRELARIARANRVIFIVNDDPTLAKEVRADGVHLGQEDMSTMPIKDARKILGKDRLIGVSTHSFTQFEKANSDDVDYIAFGPIFPTKTKDYSIGTKDVARVLAAANKPVFFIGGIDISNMGEILNMGAKNIALIRGITEARDITGAARNYKERLLQPLSRLRNDDAYANKN